MSEAATPPTPAPVPPSTTRTRKGALHARLYVSAAVQTMNRIELAQLLSAWRARNARSGITGVLLLKDADFMQYLEGPEPALTLAYAHICVDPRHTGVIELLREAIGQREFADWPMACFSVPVRPAVAHAPLDPAALRLLDPLAAETSAARYLISSFWHAGGPKALP